MNTVPIKRPPRVNCPTCSKQIEYSEQYPHRPFCSPRCKLIDLGEWASENHKINGNSIYDDLLSGDLDYDSDGKE